MSEVLNYIKGTVSWLMRMIPLAPTCSTLLGRVTPLWDMISLLGCFSHPRTLAKMSSRRYRRRTWTAKSIFDGVASPSHWFTFSKLLRISSACSEPRRTCQAKSRSECSKEPSRSYESNAAANFCQLCMRWI